MSLVEQEEPNKFLDDNLKTGRIWHLTSDFASPVFSINKKDGSMQLVQDYQKLNDITVKNQYPLPLMSDIFNKIGLAKACFFTKLDM